MQRQKEQTSQKHKDEVRVSMKFEFDTSVGKLEGAATVGDGEHWYNKTLVEWAAEEMTSFVTWANVS